MTKLYVVDDDRGFLQLIEEVAAPMGFETVVATAPRTFKSHYGGEPDSVVMLDMIMPDTDGIELLNWLSNVGPPGAVILASGFTGHYTLMAGTLAEAKGMNVVARLAKPVKLAELRAALVAAKDNGNGARTARSPD